MPVVWRWVMSWRLYEAMPRTNRVVAHAQADGRGRWGFTRCGQPLEGRLIPMHPTVAAAIAADDCKICFPQ